MKQLILCMMFLAGSIPVLAFKKITVAKDGTGDYTAVQQAIDAVPENSTDTTWIYIKNGVYKEKLEVPRGKDYIYMIGESVHGVILTYDDFASKPGPDGRNVGTSGSSSFYLFGSDFTAENITFENSSGPVGQAVAARTTGDKARFINCRFLGFQDTLYTHGDQSRQYFFKCYIEGTVDFIFGAATAVFDTCSIHAKKGGYLTAASTLPGKAYGYVFRHCNITAEAPPNSFYLGRPWRPDAKVVFMYCSMGDFIKPEGWNNWGKESNEATTFYAEYKNTGAGFKPQERVKWSHQLTDAQAANYTLKQIFGDWNPVSGL